MEQNEIFAYLPQLLLPWYHANKRELPWRGEKDPYRIWLSEIMLQQTRVEAVKGYYARFLAKLPTIDALASADDELLHKLWEGLGYYSRVRNLKKAAQRIVSDHGGVFPRDFEAILDLPGIGDYTAGAVSSIAFDQPTPAVDGNVLRVVSRLTNDPTPIDLPAYKKQVRQSLAAIYPKEAGDFTQALMELGATVCGPNRKPDCTGCPCRDICRARQKGTAEQLPVKLPKRGRRIEELTVFIISCGDEYALEKRPAKGLLAGLWQFPNVPGKLDTQQALETVEKMGLRPKNILLQVERAHIFTHVQWNMRGVYVEVLQKNEAFIWLTADQIEQQAALPTAFRQFWEEI